MIVVDTNVISEPLRPKPSEAVLRWLADNAADIAITTVTVGELLNGVERLPAGQQRDQLRAAVEGVLASVGPRLFSFDLDGARSYARVRAARMRLGRPIATEDAMIAAICINRGHALATRNGRDFEGTGLALIDPWAEPSR